MAARSRTGLALQLAAFTCVGAVATATQYLILIALVQVFAVWATTASDIGLAFGAVVSYVLNRHFTFSSRQAHTRAIPKFVFVACIGLVINTLVVASLLALDTHYLVAQVAATGIVLAWNFVMNRTWTFRGHAGGQG